MIEVSTSKSVNKYLESKIFKTIEQKLWLDCLSNESNFIWDTLYRDFID